MPIAAADCYRACARVCCEGTGTSRAQFHPSAPARVAPRPQPKSQAPHSHSPAAGSSRRGFHPPSGANRARHFDGLIALLITIKGQSLSSPGASNRSFPGLFRCFSVLSRRRGATGAAEPLRERRLSACFVLLGRGVRAGAGTAWARPVNAFFCVFAAPRAPLVAQRPTEGGTLVPALLCKSRGCGVVPEWPVPSPQCGIVCFFRHLGRLGAADTSQARGYVSALVCWESRGATPAAPSQQCQSLRPVARGALLFALPTAHTSQCNHWPIIRED